METFALDGEGSVRACRVGEPGFTAYLHQLRRLRVLSREEVLSWLQLHGAVIRLSEPPLDDESFSEEMLAQLERELGASP